MGGDSRRKGDRESQKTLAQRGFTNYNNWPARYLDRSKSRNGVEEKQSIARLLFAGLEPPEIQVQARPDGLPAVQQDSNRNCQIKHLSSQTGPQTPCVLPQRKRAAACRPCPLSSDSISKRRTISPASQRTSRWTRCHGRSSECGTSHWVRANYHRAVRSPSSRWESSVRPGSR